MYVIMRTETVYGSGQYNDSISGVVAIVDGTESEVIGIMSAFARIQNWIEIADNWHNIKTLSEYDQAIIEKFKLQPSCHDVSWKYSFRKVPVFDLTTTISGKDNG